MRLEGISKRKEEKRGQESPFPQKRPDGAHPQKRPREPIPKKRPREPTPIKRGRQRPKKKEIIIRMAPCTLLSPN
jgi:hypothetical protein